MAVGGICFESTGHFWYKFIDSRFPGNGSTNMRNKIICELVTSPLGIAMATFIIGSLEGKSIRRLWSEYKNNFWYLTLADVAFYIPFQTINYYFLQPKYRYFVASFSQTLDLYRFAIS